MSDNTPTFETYLLRTLPRTTSSDPFKCPPMSAATVSSLIAKATIDLSPLDDGLLNTINYDTGKQSSIAIFDDKGEIVSKAEYDIIKGSDRGRASVYGCQVTGRSGVIQGLHLYKDIVAAICIFGEGCALYHNCETITIFKSSLRPLDRYFGSWAAINRGSIRVDNRTFFVTADGKAASWLMDKAAVDRGDQIETVHHEQKGMVDVWADRSDLVCLSVSGDLDIVNFTMKRSRVIKSSQFKEAAFPTDRQFEASQNEAVALTGCTRYLAAATYCYRDLTSRIYLMNRSGRLLGMDSDLANNRSGSNPVHRMEFCVSKQLIFIITQNLFAYVSLYLVNPAIKATLSYIRTAQFESSGVNWTLVAIPARKDQLISTIHTGVRYMLKIRLD